MDWKKPENQTFIKAILALETTDEAQRFLRDVMTEKEIDECAKRLRAAEMLDQGISYIAIERETGLSSTTVARVAKWLNGENGGYRLVLDKMHHHNSVPVRSGLSWCDFHINAAPSVFGGAYNYVKFVL